MREVLVAVFDTAAHTEEAIQALQAAGISSSAIRRYNRDDPSIPHIGDTTTSRAGTSALAGTSADTSTAGSDSNTGGFWSWLLGEEGNTDGYRNADYDNDQ